MKIDTTFLNLQTDYGFKLLFGTPENKHIKHHAGDWLKKMSVGRNYFII